MKVPQADRELFEALTAVPSTKQRQILVKSLDPKALGKIRTHTKRLVEGRSKNYRLPPAEQKALAEALKKHRGKLRGFVDGREQKGGWLIPFLLSTLVPVVTSLFQKK